MSKYNRIKYALNMMRTQDRVVEIPKDKGSIYIEAETHRTSGQVVVDHYVCRWQGERLLATYWDEDDPLTVYRRLQANDFDIHKQCDVDLCDTSDAKERAPHL